MVGFGYGFKFLSMYFKNIKNIMNKKEEILCLILFLQQKVIIFIINYVLCKHNIYTIGAFK